jgi:beta-glucanase (GH16 family)
MDKWFTAILTLVAIAACNQPKEGWELVWTEDFDGPEIDEAVWSRVPQGRADWCDMMSLRPDLAYVEDGALVLLGKNNDGTSSDTTAFVTGGVHSKGKKSFPLARYEVKAKFNCVNGFWPALWLMADDDSGWPNGGELDIMEHLNADTLVYQTVHSVYTLNVDPKSPHGSTAPIDPEDWNVYATEIYRDSICMYTNGMKTLTYPRIEATIPSISSFPTSSGASGLVRSVRSSSPRSSVSTGSRCIRKGTGKIPVPFPYFSV